MYILYYPVLFSRKKGKCERAIVKSFPKNYAPKKENYGNMNECMNVCIYVRMYDYTYVSNKSYVFISLLSHSLILNCSWCLLIFVLNQTSMWHSFVATCTREREREKENWENNICLE